MNKEEKQAFKEVFHALLDMLEEFSLEDLESPFKGQIEAIKNSQSIVDSNRHFLTDCKTVVKNENGKTIAIQG